MKLSEGESELMGLIDSDICPEGLRVVLVQIRGGIIQVLIERQDETPVSILDCKKVSNTVGTMLLLRGVSDKGVEVLSCGSDRPLVTRDDYIRFCGSEVEILLYRPLNQLKRYSGRLVSADKEFFTLSAPMPGAQSDQEVVIPFDQVKYANLAFSEERFRKMLKS